MLFHPSLYSSFRLVIRMNFYTDRNVYLATPKLTEEKLESAKKNLSVYYIFTLLATPMGVHIIVTNAEGREFNFLFFKMVSASICSHRLLVHKIYPVTFFALNS